MVGGPTRVIWITGAGGLIGSHLARLGAPRGCEIKALTRQLLDLRDRTAVREAYRRDRPAFIIHAAGMTRTDDCERHRTAAEENNVEATRWLAELSAETPFYFFSTDLVFDGSEGGYSEEAQVNPLSWYGKTKVRAEEIVLANPRHTVIRTSLNAGRSPTGDRSFSEQMRKTWSEGKTLTFFSDEWRSPIAASETARLTWQLIDSGLTGLFHLAGGEKMSRYQMGELMAELIRGVAPRFRAASLRDYDGPPRAPDTSLDCRKLEKLLGLRCPGFSSWARAHSGELA